MRCFTEAELAAYVAQHTAPLQARLDAAQCCPTCSRPQVTWHEHAEPAWSTTHGGPISTGFDSQSSFRVGG